MNMAMGRLRVCMTTPEYPPMYWGGLAQAVQRVARFLSEMGLEVHVVNLYTEPSPPGLLDEIVESTAENGVMVHRIPVGREQDLSGNTLWDSPDTLSVRLMYHCLERLYREYEFDVFHSFFIYPAGYVAALLTEVYEKKLILSIRGNDINQYIFSPEKTTLLQIALRRANLVTSVSRDLLVKADILAPIMDKSRVIFNSIAQRDGVTPPVTHPQLEGSVIGAVGLFKYSKGLPYLLKAFQGISKERRSSLLLVGDFREVEREIQTRYLLRFGSESVHVTGPVPHELIGSYLNRMDVFVIPSLSEGCPNGLLEAMAAARPIVATRTGAIPEIIRDGESGLLVDVGDATQIKEAVLYVLDHPEKGEALGRRACERIEEFSEEREREEWGAVYRLIAES